MNPKDLNKLLGNIDIYLLDQILKERFSKDMRILDAGCGEGRNAIYFLNEGYRIFGIDQEELGVQYLKYLAKTINPNYDLDRFQIAKLEEIPFHDGAFDAIICSAVFHFAQSEKHFFQMLNELLRVLKLGGIFWFRTCTGFGGILEQGQPIGKGRFLLPDGSERFVITREILQQIEELGLKFLEEPKTVLVLDQREMGIFLMEKLGK